MFGAKRQHIQEGNKVAKRKRPKTEEITVVSLVQSTDINNSVPQPCSQNTCYPNQM